LIISFPDEIPVIYLDIETMFLYINIVYRDEIKHLCIKKL